MKSADNSFGQVVRQSARRSIRSFAEAAASLSLRSRTLRAYAFDALHLLTPAASATVDGLHYTFSTDDWIIGRSLYVTGQWDNCFLEAIVNLLDSEPPGRRVANNTFIDVGANIGTTTLQALHRFNAARVVAIEPSRECLPYLRSNIAANCFWERCAIVEAAVSDVEDELAFRAGRGNSGGGALTSGGGEKDYLVPTRRLDDILAQLGISSDEISVVWIDTEGHEYRVLSGADGILASGAPFVIEFWPDRLRHNGDFDSLIGLLAHRFGRIIDIRAHVHGDLKPPVEPTVISLTARANALGRGQTDLLLLP